MSSREWGAYTPMYMLVFAQNTCPLTRLFSIQRVCKTQTHQLRKHVSIGEENPYGFWCGQLTPGIRTVHIAFVTCDLRALWRGSNRTYEFCSNYKIVLIDILSYIQIDICKAGAGAGCHSPASCWLSISRIRAQWGWLGSHFFCFFLALFFLADINNGRLAFSGTPKIFELRSTKQLNRGWKIVCLKLSSLEELSDRKEFSALILWADQLKNLGLSQDTTIHPACPKTNSSISIWLNSKRLSCS